MTRARAFANLALVKYFGKRDTTLNLPATGSLSLTLFPLETLTDVDLDPGLFADEVTLSGVPAPAGFVARVARFLDLVRATAGRGERARVSTSNAFPTAAGLASSASGFAALALAASRAYGLSLDARALSALARRGSGSAARSVFGGVAVWDEGTRDDGADSVARPLLGPDDWDLRVVAGVASSGPKALGSTEAMERTRLTSPYYGAWLEATRADLAQALAAVESRDLFALGEVTERSALAMHAAAMAARPGIVYFRGATVEALRVVRELRAAGHAAYFTCDAGPQPKVLCDPASEDAVAAALTAVPGIESVIRCRLGPGAALA
ncbi:MAG: diphosphomevalonate decarboxylase [Deltaproteobacteria bacterium]|nr:diphosphomevalonate decarboxylase [Deltaproteobacteria bacterium]